jgi:IS605 OrfB family transposase
MAIAIKRAESVHKQECAAALPGTDCAAQDLRGPVVETLPCCIKVPVPDALALILETLEPWARICVDRMLVHRERSSTAFYPELPSVIAKSLIAKYQRNKKCKTVTNLVLPLCGDQGRQIKLHAAGIRIPALFQKKVLPVIWLRNPVGFIRSVEFIRRGGRWFACICYHARKEALFRPIGTIGVDRNSVGGVATLADPQNGKVFHLGFHPAGTKAVWRGRRANLQSIGKRRLLHKIRNKQSRRTKYENHKVSKQIVDYAVKHRRAIVLEKLERVRSGRMRHDVEKSQWSFYQLFQFILYKAALQGVMVMEVDPAYTSQECSRCHQLSKPNGKSFRCGYCGHHDHRDANAAFTLAERVMPIGGVATESERRVRGLLVVPFLGMEVQQCT